MDRYHTRTRIRRLYILLTLIKSSNRYNSRKSIFICFSHVLLSLPRLFLPSSIRLFTILTRASTNLLFTCPYHFSLFSRNFIDKWAIPSLCLNSWFLIILILQCPYIHFIILISTTPYFVQSTSLQKHCVSYNNVGLMKIRWNLPFSLVGDFLSHNTSVDNLQLSQIQTTYI